MPAGADNENLEEDEMNIKEIKDMITLMNENGLVEIEIEKDGLKLRLKKGNAGIQQDFSVMPIQQAPAAPAVSQPHQAQHAKEADLSTKGFIEIKSPMVGTFYMAPSPDAPPYVQEGQNIDVGQVVCIVEAMKLMNEIKSEIKGRVVKILVENADPVEYGQTLFLIDSGK